MTIDWTERVFYKRLITAFPELIRTLPGKYEDIHRVTKNPYAKEDEKASIITLKTCPFKSIVPDSPIIDKALYVNSTQVFLNRKLGKPSTQIEHIKRAVLKSIIDIFKPISSYIFGLYFEGGKEWGKIKAGDIKVELTGSHSPGERYTMLLNHNSQTARMLNKRTTNYEIPLGSKLNKYEFCIGNDFPLYLWNIGINMDMSNRIEK